MRNDFGDPERARHLRLVVDDYTDDFTWYCDNGLCGKELPDDHTIVGSTGHVRRFCRMGCIVEGYLHHLDSIALSEGLTLSEEQKLVRRHLRVRCDGGEGAA
jgi:hypothetical protein